MRPFTSRGSIPREYQRQPAGRSIPIPAPILGMNTRDGVSSLDPREARLIENMVPDDGKLVIRGGKTTHQTIGSGSSTGSCFTHEGVSDDVLLVASDGKIFDATGTPSQLASGFSLNTWSFAQFDDTTIAVNGTDTPWAYTSSGGFDSTTGFSGSGLTIANLRTVSVVGIRLWFTEEASADVWYGDVNAITGTLTKFQLAQETKGGYCVGVYPFREYTTFLMSTGEIVIYAGDPGSNFSLAGSYDSPKPVGYDPAVLVGGDLVIMTVNGPIPLEYITSGVAFDTKALQSWGKIAPSWVKDWKTCGSLSPWNAAYLNGLVIFNVPTDSTTSKQWVFNTRVKGWSQWTNLNASQFTELGGTIYFGAKDDNVVFTNTGGTDGVDPIVATIRGGFVYPFESQVNGQFTLARLNINATNAVTAQIQVDVDFNESGISAPAVIVAIGGSGPWGEPWGSPWGSEGAPQLRWHKVKGYGRAVAPVARFSSQSDTLEYFATDLIVAPAGMI